MFLTTEVERNKKGKATKRHHSQESGPGETPLISPRKVAEGVGMEEKGSWNIGMGYGRLGGNGDSEILGLIL